VQRPPLTSPDANMTRKPAALITEDLADDSITVSTVVHAVVWAFAPAKGSPRLVRSGVGESLREPGRDIIDADGQNRSVCRSEIGLEGYRRAVAPKAIGDSHRAL